MIQVNNASTRRLLTLSSRLVVVLVIIRAVFYYLDLDIGGIYDSSSEHFPAWAKPGSITSGLSWFDGHDALAEDSRFCSNDDWVYGRWEPRSDPFDDLESLKAGLELNEEAQLQCVPKTHEGGLSPDDSEHTQRLLSVSNWDYIPRDGCLVHQFSAGDFVRRSLRSKAGFTIVGDSLQEQLYATLKDLLVHPGGPLVAHSYQPKNVHTIELNPNHPDTPGLLQGAGVVSSRAAVPVVTYHRDNAVLSRAEIDECYLGKSANYRSLVAHPEFQAIALNVNTTWYPDWMDLLENSPSPIDPASGDDVREEENVMIVTYGPHWTYGVMGDIGHDDLLPGYLHSIEIMLKKLQDVKHFDIRAFWRATAPGHPDCEIYDEAEPDRDNTKSTANPEKSMFNWDYFTAYNDAWAEAAKSSSSLIEFLNIWPMSVSRPDAHKNPPFDCLHFCQPGPPLYWIQYLWHQLASTTRNRDQISDW